MAPVVADGNDRLRELIGRGWEAAWRAWFGEGFIEGMAGHHREAVGWHWESRIARLEGRKPEYLAYFPIWPRGHAKCVDEGTEILMGDGSRKPIRDICDRDIVQSWDEFNGKMVLGTVKKVWESGVKSCVELVTRTGWNLTATRDHKVQTLDGWKRIGELLPTDRIAVPRKTGVAEVEYAISDEEIRLITYFLMEGCTTINFSKTDRPQLHSSLTNADAVIVEDMKYCANVLGFDLVKINDRDKGGKLRYGYNLKSRDGDRFSAKNWIRGHGMAGKKSTEKRLPAWFFQLSSRQIRQVVSVVLDTDGFVARESVGVTLANADLIRDLRYLFLQIGIVAKEYKRDNKFAGSWSLIFDHHNLDRHLDLPLRLKGNKWDRLLLRSRYSLIDCYPTDILENLPKGMNRLIRRQGQSLKSHKSQRVTRDKVQRALEIYPSPHWLWLENAEVLWDEIRNITEVGEKKTYDLEVEGTHNFLANGIVTHNSFYAERMSVVDGILSVAYGEPGYTLYVARSKSKVEEHIQNIERILSSEGIRGWCPGLSNPKRSVTTDQQSKWTSTFLKSEAGYSWQGGSLDSGLAGSRVEETRPSYIVMDDIDGREDSPVIAESRMRQLTLEIIPMRQANTLYFFAQNLISRYSCMYRIHKGESRVLVNRKPGEPIPAVYDLVTREEVVNGIVKDIYVSGESSWPQVWDAERIQDEIDSEGLPSFLRELQHEVDEDREGQIFYNYDDSVHVISESEFALKFGSVGAWLTWRKKPGNDWARTKTARHANVAGWLAISDVRTEAPNMIFFMYPMSFPPNSAPEDVAERLLSVLSPYAYVEQGRQVTWGELRKELLSNVGNHTDTLAEEMDFRRGAMSRVVPKYSAPLLQRCNVQQGEMSHEMDTVRKIYRSVYGLGFRGINPRKHGGIEQINRDLRVDYEIPHVFRPNQMGYTRWYMVVPDDVTQPYRNGDKTVFLPRSFPTTLKSETLEDSDLARYQFKNWRTRPATLTAAGEEIDIPEKMNDDFCNMAQFWAVGAPLQGTSLTAEQKVDLLIPEEVKTALKEKEGNGAMEMLEYNWQRQIASGKIFGPRRDTILEELE
jgi:intein/homing endonuclease